MDSHAQAHAVHAAWTMEYASLRCGSDRCPVSAVGVAVGVCGVRQWHARGRPAPGVSESLSARAARHAAWPRLQAWPRARRAHIQLYQC